MAKLGHLERVDLRAEWPKEDCDFTPWLAQEENIALLGETLNISLEVEEEERPVGRFRADILCKDIGSTEGGWVVIENQLEATDHSHLGQIMTYAAGLEAKTCIWVAAKFHEEHRTAIDWLNDITDEEQRFFALEIELWRIADSLSAPKFNIVSQPNDWKGDVGRAARSIQASALTETGQLQLAFWEDLATHMADNPTLKNQKPRAKSWTIFSIGRTGMNLDVSINTKKNYVTVGLYLGGKNAQTYFKQLQMDQEKINAEVGLKLDWRPLPNKIACRIITQKPMEALYLSDRSKWPELHQWISDTLDKMHGCFAPRVRIL